MARLPNPFLSSSPARAVLDPDNWVEQPITLKHCNDPVTVVLELMIPPTNSLVV